MLLAVGKLMSDSSAVNVVKKLGEPKGLLIGGIAAGVAGIMADLLSPIYATSFHKGFGLDNTQAGFLVTAALGTMAIVEFGLAHWIEKANLKKVTAIGIVISCFALAYISLVAEGTFLQLVIGMIALGLGCGLAFVAGNAALSFANNSSRAFSLLTMWYMIFTLVMMTTNPFLRDIMPIVVPYAAMIVVQIICLVLVLWKLPDMRELSAQVHAAEEAVPSAEGAESAHGIKLFSPIPLMLSVAVMLSQLAVAGLWTFAQELGASTGMSAESVSSFLGISQVIGLVGTLAPWLLGKYIGRAVLGAFGFLLASVGIVLAAAGGTTTLFITGNLMINLGYWITLPLALSVAADLDKNSGKLVAFMLGMSSIGLAIGPSLAGPLLGGDNPAMGGWIFGIVSLVAVPLILVPARRADVAAKEYAEKEAAEIAAGAAVPGLKD